MEKRLARRTHSHTIGPRGANHRSPTYNTWRSVVSRCTCPTDTAYASYGAKGISVCDEWRSFEVFLADMGVRPEGTSIDRIDNERGYSPDNCRWASRTEQNRNRRNVRQLTINGETLSLPVWAERTGLNPRIIHTRLARGWSVERAVGQ